jgi:arginase
VIDALKSDLTRRIAVLGAPIEIGASQRGTLMGPASLRTAGLLTLLDGLGFEVEDHGDLSISDVAELADAPLMSWRDPARSRSFSAAITRCRWVR